MEQFEQFDNSRDELIDGIAGATRGYGYGGRSFGNGAASVASPRSRRGGKGAKFQTPADCGPNQTWVGPFSRKGHTRTRIYGTRQVRGANVAGFCRRVFGPTAYNAAVAQYTQQNPGLDATEAAWAMKQEGLWTPKSPRNKRGGRRARQF